MQVYIRKKDYERWTMVEGEPQKALDGVIELVWIPASDPVIQADRSNGQDHSSRGGYKRAPSIACFAGYLSPPIPGVYLFYSAGTKEESPHACLASKVWRLFRLSVHAPLTHRRFNRYPCKPQMPNPSKQLRTIREDGACAANPNKGEAPSAFLDGI